MNYPFTVWGLISNTPAQLAWGAVQGFIHLQSQYPDRETVVDTRSPHELVLRVKGELGELPATKSLWTALKGKWQEMDVQELGGENNMTMEMTRANVAFVELVERRF